MSNDAVFESSKYPIVRFPGIYDETYDEDDVSMCEEKKEDDDDSKLSHFVPCVPNENSVEHTRHDLDM